MEYDKLIREINSFFRRDVFEEDELIFFKNKLKNQFSSSHYKHGLNLINLALIKYKLLEGNHLPDSIVPLKPIKRSKKLRGNKAKKIVEINYEPQYKKRFEALKKNVNRMALRELSNEIEIREKTLLLILKDKKFKDIHSDSLITEKMFNSICDLIKKRLKSKFAKIARSKKIKKTIKKKPVASISTYGKNPNTYGRNHYRKGKIIYVRM